jgi:hypothetical protein
MEEPIKNDFDLQALCFGYAGEVVQALAIAQKGGQITGPEDLQRLIAAGIETAFEDLLEKMKPKSKIELS